MQHPFALCISPRAAVVAALAATLAACGDATGPGKTVSVAVSVTSVEGPRIAETADHVAQLICRVNLQAVATGEGKATWTGATLRFYVGPNHQTLVDTATFSGPEIAHSWSADGQIGVGQVQTTHWDITAALPFYMTIEYRYKPPHRGEATASASFSCGMPAAFSASPPVVTALTVTPPSGELNAGAPLSVTYTVDAPAGLWRTDVVVSGPCDTVLTVNEMLTTTSTTRTVSVPIAGTCNLGVPITVDVYVLDALLQSGQRRLVTQVVLADLEPPVLVVSLPSAGGFEDFKGDFFGGDYVLAGVSAHDNHALSAIVWEIAPTGVRDSLLFSGPVLYTTDVRVQLPNNYSGDVQLRFFARDQQGLESPVQSTLAGNVRLHPTVVRPTRVASLAGEMRGLAIDSRRNNIYLSDATHRQIAIFSMATMQVTGVVDVAGTPEDLDLTPSGDSLVVVLAGQRALGIVDLRGAAPVATTMTLPWLDSATAQTPNNVRIGANGRAYMTLRAINGTAQTMNELDLATGAARMLPGAASQGGIPFGQIERSGDAAVLAVNVYYDCLRRYDVAADVFSACAEHGTPDITPSVDATGAHIAMSLNIFDASMQRLPKIRGRLVSWIPFVALVPDGSAMYVSVQDYVVKLRVSDSEVLERTANPVQPSIIRVTPDGQSLVSFVSDSSQKTTRIALINLR